jgi:hypothetical protein
MINHPYEYKMLLEYISPENARKSPHFTHIEDQESLTMTIDDVFTHLPEEIPEGWEVNSHGITISHNTIIISVLLRKKIA